MKNFIISLALITACISVILTDMVLVRSAAASMRQTVAALPTDFSQSEAADTAQAAQNAADQFKRLKYNFYISQHYSEIERLETEYAAMARYAGAGEQALYSASRERILIYLQSVESNVRITWDNII